MLWIEKLYLSIWENLSFIAAKYKMDFFPITSKPAKL